MSGRHQTRGTDPRVLPLGLVDPFLEAKLHWPRVHDGWVDRHRLLDLFDLGTRRPVVLVAAPAGYGKTTLAAQWLAERRGTRAAAWISLDEGDNDPGRLWTHVAVALDRAGCSLPPDVARPLTANNGELSAGALPKLVRALASLSQQIVILFDDFHFVESAACHEQMGFLSRTSPNTPMWSSSPEPTPDSAWADCAPRVCWPRSEPNISASPSRRSRHCFRENT